MAAFNVDAFRPIEDFKRDDTDFAVYLKSTPPAAGFTEVYYPGELEYLSTQRKQQEGIEVEDATWQRLKNLAVQYGVAERLGIR